MSTIEAKTEDPKDNQENVSTSYDEIHSPASPNHSEQKNQKDTSIEYNNGFFAFILSMIAPGLGYAALGARDWGILLNLAFVIIPGIIIAAIITLKLFPLFALIVLWFVFISARLWVAFKTMQSAKNSHKKMQSRRILIGINIALWTYILPTILAYFGTSFFFQRTIASSDAMKPTIQKGDVIWVDKSAYKQKIPKYGDLVYVEEPGNLIYFARVIAKSPQTIEMRGATPYIDDNPLIQQPYRTKSTSKIKKGVEYKTTSTPDTNIPTNDNTTPDPSPHNEPHTWYEIMMSDDLLMTKSEFVQLKRETLFVLEDNRKRLSQQGNTGSMGRVVHYSWIKGRPLFVLYNREDNQPMHRTGIKLR